MCGRADHNRKGHYRWQEALIEEGVELVDENYDDPTFLQVTEFTAFYYSSLNLLKSL